MKTIGIVDYGVSNLDSIARAVEVCGARAKVTSDPADLPACDALVLPGVGSFRRGMENLRARGLADALDALARDGGRPFLGICLGMQLMASRGTEGGETAGLGWIEGEVVRLEPETEGERVPHMGWNELEPTREDALLQDVPAGTDVYFVHSYHLAPADPAAVLARTPHCGGFVSAVARGNLWGVQFHPEKSQRVGFRILKNFLGIEG